jgi:hypothetical protein
MRLPFLAFVFLLLFPAAAAAYDYSYLEAGFFQHEDTDDTDHVNNRGNTLLGYRTAMVIGMPTWPLAYFTEYGNTDVLEQFSVGLLYAQPVAPWLDVTGGASVEFEDMTDEQGYGLRAGLRWSPLGPQLEVNPEVRHEELFRASTSVRLTMVLQVARRVYVEGAAQAGDEERYVLGLRYALPWRSPRLSLIGDAMQAPVADRQQESPGRLAGTRTRTWLASHGFL